MKKYLNRNLLIILLFVLLAVSLVAVVACDDNNNTPPSDVTPPSDDTSSPMLTAKFDDSHIVYERDSLDSLKPYFTVTYTNEKGESTQLTDFNLIGSLTVGNCKIAVNYQDLTVIVTVTVLQSTVEPDVPSDEPKNQPMLTAVFDSTHTVYDGDTLNSLKPYFTVTYTNEKGESIQLTDFNLIGSLTVGNCKIAVNYQDLTVIVTVTVLQSTVKPDVPSDEPKNQPVLTAVFDSTHTVYDGDTLDSLKNYLAVTYKDENGNTSNVTGYTLIGSLTVGDNLIAVLYKDVTAIISIDVVKKPTVTFLAAGQVVAVRTYTKYNLSVSEPMIPSKPGYDGRWENYTLTVDSGDITVNAVYTAKTYIVTFDYNGADGNMTTQSIVVVYGQPIDTLPTPTLTDFDFAGWYYNYTIVNSGDNCS